MYEESLITPFIMKLPNRDSSLVNSNLVMNLDFAPTILDYAGVDVPEDMQGKSLKPVLEGEGFNRKGQYYHYYEFPHGWHSVKKHYGVRTEAFKLIHYYDEVDEWEMFDLKKDPGEMNNIYGVEDYQIKQQELHSLLNELKTQYKDSIP
tara:strand:- start:1508 stop:1954 length:447 start_codon:yes stop_codon:yes gene_type:complete